MDESLPCYHLNEGQDAGWGLGSGGNKERGWGRGGSGSADSGVNGHHLLPTGSQTTPDSAEFGGFKSYFSRIKEINEHSWDKESIMSILSPGSAFLD